MKLCRIRMLTPFLLGLLALAETFLVGAGSGSTSQAGYRPQVQGEVMVKFEPGVNQTEIDRLNAAHGATIIDSIPRVGVLRLRTSSGLGEEQLAAAYRRSPHVEFAELNHFFQTTDTTPNDPWFPNWQKPLQRIHAPAAWDITTGSAGVIIAIVDSGADYAHPDLAAQLLPGYDFVNGDSSPSDDNGHGTHVAGVAAAITNNGEGVAGTCWSCRLLPLKAFDQQGIGSSSAIAPAIIYAADQGAKVINMSFSGPDSRTVKSAIDYAFNKGLVLVGAAGNSGGSVEYPAAYSNVLAVSALDADNIIAAWSNRGPEIDLAAPGTGVVSTSLFVARSCGCKYAFMSGTSVAAPFVSGSAALVAAQAPTLSPSAAMDILKKGTDDLGSPGTDPLYGAGMVNPYGALTALGSQPIDQQPGGTSPSEQTHTATFSGSLGFPNQPTAASHQVSIGRDGTLVATLTWSAKGDLDLYLFDSQDELMASAKTAGKGAERLEATVSPGQYTLKVMLVSGRGKYTLSVTYPV